MSVTQKYLSWDDILSACVKIADKINNDPITSNDNYVVLAPHYGGWPVATITINILRRLKQNSKFKPAIITENDLTRHLLIPLITHKNIVIFDDVLDTGKVIHGIIWRIIHECETFLNKEEILQKIIVCTIGKKRDCEYNVTHHYIHTWPPHEWINYPWE